MEKSEIANLNSFPGQANKFRNHEYETNTLSSSWTEDLVELEHPMSIFSMFGWIHNKKLTIFTNIVYGCKFSALTRKERSDPAVDPDISYAKQTKL